MSLRKSTVYLKNKRHVLPLYLSKEIHKELTILSQEFGVPVNDVICEAIVRYLYMPNNKYLLEQTEYNRVNPVDKILSQSDL